MDNNKYISDHDAFIFELDDVLYPEKDYLLQVYYLFAQFMEYTEQMDGTQIVQFMQEVYQQEGATGLFAKTASRFSIDEKYLHNYELLHKNARLPLKLLLFAPVLEFMQESLAKGKRIFLLTGGDPEMQLNKIKQLEWNGIEQHLTAYFAEEIAKGSIAASVEVIVNFHALSADRVVFVGKQATSTENAFGGTIKFLPIAKLLVS